MGSVGSVQFQIVPCSSLYFSRSIGPFQCESKSEVTQSCPTLCDPMDCSLPGSSVHGIFQAIVLGWIAISFSRGPSQPRDRTPVSHIVDRRFIVWATRGSSFWKISHIISIPYLKSISFFPLVWTEQIKFWERKYWIIIFMGGLLYIQTTLGVLSNWESNTESLLTSAIWKALNYIKQRIKHRYTLP